MTETENEKENENGIANFLQKALEIYMQIRGGGEGI